MAKHERIRRLRAEREAAKEAVEEVERGPISPVLASRRARVRGIAGVGSGTWAFGTKVRRDIKKRSVFKDKAPKKTRTKKRGRR